jgi:hypothetical protein
MLFDVMRSAVMFGPIFAEIGFAGLPEEFEFLLRFAVA